MALLCLFLAERNSLVVFFLPIINSLPKTSPQMPKILPILPKIKLWTSHTNSQKSFILSLSRFHSIKHMPKIPFKMPKTFPILPKIKFLALHTNPSQMPCLQDFQAFPFTYICQKLFHKCQKLCQKCLYFAKNKIFGIFHFIFSAILPIFQTNKAISLFISNKFHLPKTGFSKNTMSQQNYFYPVDRL